MGNLKKNTNYIKGKGILVGCFDENAIKNGDDKIALADMQRETGYKYCNTEFVKRNGKIIGIKIYVCTLDDMKIKF